VGVGLEGAAEHDEPAAEAARDLRVGFLAVERRGRRLLGGDRRDVDVVRRAPVDDEVGELRGDRLGQRHVRLADPHLRHVALGRLGGDGGLRDG
jgi:hypothetical protein